VNPRLYDIQRSLSKQLIFHETFQKLHGINGRGYNAIIADHGSYIVLLQLGRIFQNPIAVLIVECTDKRNQDHEKGDIRVVGVPEFGHFRHGQGAVGRLGEMIDLHHFTEPDVLNLSHGFQKFRF